MLKDIRKTVEELKENEAKSLLLLILLKIDKLERASHSREQTTVDLGDELRAIYKELLNLSQANNQAAQTYQAAHIAFGDSAAGALRVTLKELGLEREEKVIGFSGLFSIGPIWKLQEQAGRAYRCRWLKNNINFEDDYYCEADYEDNFKDILHQIDSIPGQIPIIIWNGENAHEQTGARFALYLMRKKTNDVFLINTAQVYKANFKRPGIEFAPLHTAEISPEKLKVIYEQSKSTKPLAHEYRKQLELEWENLAVQQEVLRIWSNGTIQSAAVDFFDPYIVSTARKLHNEQKNRDFMKSARLIGEVLVHLDQYVGDLFLEYRVRNLIYDGVLEIEGIPKAMRYYSIKLRQKNNERD